MYENDGQNGFIYNTIVVILWVILPAFILGLSVTGVVYMLGHFILGVW